MNTFIRLEDGNDKTAKNENVHIWET